MRLKRTGVQIMPRAIPCTSSDNLAKGSSHANSLGAFAFLQVRARKPGGLVLTKMIFLNSSLVF